MLRKCNEDWILPKGRAEGKELLEQTAIREVYEESKVKVELVKYLGKIKYDFNRTSISGSIDEMKFY